MGPKSFWNRMEKIIFALKYHRILLLSIWVHDNYIFRQFYKYYFNLSCEINNDWVLKKSSVTPEIFWTRCVMLRQWLPVTLSYNNWNWVSTTTAIYFHRLIPTSFHLFDNRFSVPAISALKIVSFFTHKNQSYISQVL